MPATISSGICASQVTGLTALAVTQSVKGELNSYGEMFEPKS